MACNCKRKIELEDKYGEKEEEGLFTKLSRYALKAFVFALTIFSAIILIPIMIFVVIYKIFFAKKREIILPKAFRRFMQ